MTDLPHLSQPAESLDPGRQGATRKKREPLPAHARVTPLATPPPYGSISTRHVRAWRTHDWDAAPSPAFAPAPPSTTPTGRWRDQLHRRDQHDLSGYRCGQL